MGQLATDQRDRTWQLGPVQPSAQRHRPSTHAPCPEQLLVHAAHWHAEPVKLSSHRHSPSTHLPWMQGLQSRSLHVSPSHPAKQKHLFSLQEPCALQSSGQTVPSAVNAVVQDGVQASVPPACALSTVNSDARAQTTEGMRPAPPDRSARAERGTRLGPNFGQVWKRGSGWRRGGGDSSGRRAPRPYDRELSLKSRSKGEAPWWRLRAPEEVEDG